jgi:hypothetical protein
LPWQQNLRDAPTESSIEFGQEPKGVKLLDLAAQIRTFVEGTDPNSSDIVTIRQKMLEVDLLVFLGFAFHRINLDLLRPEDIPTDNLGSVRCLATAKGISDSDCQIITSELNELNPRLTNYIILRNDLTCNQLLSEYWRTLSLTSPPNRDGI